MRRVKFTLWDRLVLTPIEIKEAAKIALPVLGVLFLVNLVASRPFGGYDLLLIVAAILAGAFVTPILLPWIPGRAFAFKGWLAGAIGTGALLWAFGWLASPWLLLGIGYLLVMPAVSAFLAMNYTGNSTYTSPTGVLKEMRIALPLIISSAAVGMILILIKTFAG
jgi:hypothetical protein